ncbi:hypothetical protein [Avibacterium paragallinarum]|uniref:hypothetical protein n=1 Tax=Avibacterium paragallinarum TaxID=728 RepID=UPI00021ACF7C|nr:hypothetical protein [Avibacterium paragallinarum]AZI14544.1 hypothetical protein EIA51_07935 [Avibacterium paragallinarum]QIR11123.1 hypothetical protein HBL79_02030 [Avibacterium paragallinarum]QJE10057.1 hypothetical protein HHJ62_06995 [Avibacterium paragallinarum]QJE12251.1 hypothetical protein HHJ61_07000 [Avibacterium paragallinarum]QJE14453.1 hypothetical protein HHJ60_07020 [Avibacterium paragallinarum]
MEIKETLHVRDFIYHGLRFVSEDCPLLKEPGDINYARWIMSMHDVPATLSFDIEEYVKQFPLYCMYNGIKHKFINVSRLGDVFITDNLESESYNKRVSITNLYQFSKEV